MKKQNKKTKKEIKEKPPVKERQTGKKEKYAYTVKDKNFPDFKVLNSANAWWLDRVKVENIITAYKIDATDEEARTYAGISEEQLKYFKELHPDFYQVKEACKQIPFLKARQRIIKDIEVNGDLALKYMERKKKDEFSPRHELVGSGGGPIQMSYEKRLKEMREKYGNKEKKGT